MVSRGASIRDDREVAERGVSFYLLALNENRLDNLDLNEPLGLDSQRILSRFSKCLVSGKYRKSSSLGFAQDDPRLFWNHAVGRWAALRRVACLQLCVGAG